MLSWMTSRFASDVNSEVSAFDRTRLGETVERPDASREVVQTGEVFKVTAIAA